MSSKLKSLHNAVITNNIVEATKLVSANNVNYMDAAEGLSLLAWAVTLGFTDMVALLLQRGAAVALCDRNGFQPIHRAVWFKRPAIVKLLLAAGADPLAVNRRNQKTPLSLAAMCGSVEIARMLITHRPQPAEGVDIDVRDANGCSALDTAAASGSHEMVEYLLSSGADAFFSRVCANEGAEGAKTWAERRSYDEINRLLCAAWAPQSRVTM